MQAILDLTLYKTLTRLTSLALSPHYRYTSSTPYQVAGPSTFCLDTHPLIATPIRHRVVIYDQRPSALGHNKSRLHLSFYTDSRTPAPPYRPAHHFAPHSSGLLRHCVYIRISARQCALVIGCTHTQPCTLTPSYRLAKPSTSQIDRSK